MHTHFSKHEASTPAARVVSFAADMNDRGVLDFPKADTRGRQQRVNTTRSRTPAKPALSNRNIEICQRVMPGNDVLISSVESGLAEASRPR